MSATESPFGLLAEIGAAIAAELGMTPRQIAEELSAQHGRFVGDSTARAAAQRGRRELTARRLRPELFRPVRKADVEPPAEPVNAAATREQPAPAKILGTSPQLVRVDETQELLKWADHGPQRAGTLAGRVRAELAELAAIHAKHKATVQHTADKTRAAAQRRQDAALSLPANASVQQRREYFRAVRHFGLANGLPVGGEGRVPVRTIRAYESSLAQERAEVGRILQTRETAATKAA